MTHPMGFRSRAALCAGVCAIALASVPGEASAQSAAPTTGAVPQAQASSAASNAAAQPQTGLGEIVVTAQRRSEALKNVPISIQAVTGESLSRQAVRDTRDLASISPTLNFSEGNNAASSGFTLRGITSIAQEGGIQPSSAVVLDGVPLIRQAEFVSDLADVQRIEVLNGPQGTLFGKNSTAGVINIVVNQPTDRWEALVQGTTTTDEEYGVRGMINVPVANGIRARVNAFYRDQEPFIKNLSGPDAAGAKSYGFDGKIAFDLGPDATFTLDGAYIHRNSSYGQVIPIGVGLFGAAQQAIVGTRIGRGADVINMDGPNFDIFTSRHVYGTLKWKLADDLNLTSITNYTHTHEDGYIDVDATPAGLNIGTGVSPVGQTYPFRSIYRGLPRIPDDNKYFSQEVRLNYDRGPLNVVGGGFYQHLKNNYSAEVALALDGSLAGLTPGTQYFSSAIPKSTLKDDTASVFGDVTLKVFDKIKVFGGARFTHETLNVDYHRDTYFNLLSQYDAATGVDNAAPIDVYDTSSRHRINNISGRAGVQYQPTTNLNFYASYAHGYKGPAADLGSTLSKGVDPIIKPEIANAYEIGAKLRLFNNRVSIDGDIFYQEINNIQESVVPPGITIVNVLLNAGKLKSKGAEASVNWQVVRELRLSGGFAYVDAYYSGFSYNCNSTQLATGSCPNNPTTGFQDITGQQAIGSPKYKYSITADYEHKVDAGGSIFAQVNWVWNSSIQYQLGDDPLTREPSHGLLGGSFGFRGPGEKWEVQFFGKNLLNRHYYTSLNNVPTIGSPIGAIPRDFHRYAGVTLTARY